MVLADEPTGNLDSAASREIMEILHELNHDGITVIIVTHEPEVAAYTPECSSSGMVCASKTA